MSVTIEHMTTETLLERLGRRCSALLHRAHAREAAARRALAHARAVQNVQKTELAILQERARGLEQIIFDYAINRHPLRARSAASLAHTPQSTTQTNPVTPFDPAALVAAMLPLAEPAPREIEVDVEDALGRCLTGAQHATAADAHARGARHARTAPRTGTPAELGWLDRRLRSRGRRRGLLRREPAASVVGAEQ
jgi:hypothetical protein